MSEKKSVSKKPAQKANFFQQQGKAEGPTNNSIVKPYKYHALDAPSNFLLDPSGHFQSLYVKSPQHFEAFTRVGSPVPATCAVSKNYTDEGQFVLADCSLVPCESVIESALPIYTVALHPCVFKTGECFILLQLVRIWTAEPEPLEWSFADALSVPIGQWLKVRANPDRKRVEYELLEPQMTDTPAYPNFLADVLATAIAAQIPDLEAHIRDLISEMPHGPVPHCTDAEGLWPNTIRH